MQIEFTIEPFVDGNPGEHVRAAWQAVEALGAELTDGPFGSSSVVPADRVGEIVGDLLRAAFGAGAVRVSLHAERLDR